MSKIVRCKPQVLWGISGGDINMISNKNRRLIAIAMLKDIGASIKKQKLIDWFIDVSEKGSTITMSDVSVNDLVSLAKSIGIKVEV